MIILKEKKQPLDEMSIRVISTLKDNLPFRITIQTPDKAEPDHAHIRDLKTGKILMGAFLVSKNPPHSPRDIKDWKEGITENMRQLVFDWSKRPNEFIPITNWQALVYECEINRNS